MIILILGPMMAGKTTELIRLLNREKIAGKDVLLVRPNTDNRGFLTHSGFVAGIEEVFVDEISEVNYNKYDVIGVDEGQFFKNLSRDANKIADEEKLVIISALNGTSERDVFESVQELIPHAEIIDKKNAVCTECGSQHATFSYYKTGDKTDKVKTGDSHQYEALCRKCYNKKSVL